MSPKGTIDAYGIWKRFRADRQRSLMRDELVRLGTRLSGSGAGWSWALKDVSVRAEAGDSVGLVGSNGSGKSTLLRILSKVMFPYAGRVDVAGRIGALIEVRSGIHPELTGRENIYIYGTLLGLKRREVAARFDQIVQFAELESAVDRQVKFYSSGMQMRLGFAVAAFLEPDVLLIDEVLAVGDASFQQKCLERVREVLGSGTTVLFVSHDLAAVEAVCNLGVWLEGGVVRATGEIGEVLGAYRRWIEESAQMRTQLGDQVRLLNVRVSGSSGSPKTQETLEVALSFAAQEDASGQLFVGISEGPANPILSVGRDLHFASGSMEVRCKIARLPLPRGRFYLWVGIGRGRRWQNDLIPWHPAAAFDVFGPDLEAPPRAIVRIAPIHVDAEWEIASPGP